MAPLEISITAIGTVSPLGFGADCSWQAYRDPGHYLTRGAFPGDPAWAGQLPDVVGEALSDLTGSRPEYAALDRSVLLAILASRIAVKQAGWGRDEKFGVNIGSSRGATGLFERYFGEYSQSGRVPSLASPSTTLGNIASWVAQDLGTSGPGLSHSITCSTALHALLNGVAWLRSGMAPRFLCGGSEAPLTGFTLAQMQALKIYSREETGFPCLSLDPSKTNNSMVLGEGAGSVCLEPGIHPRSLATIRGVGYATEKLKHAVSLSADAACLQESMRLALGDLPAGEVDVVIAHAPGTRKGDLAELRAIEAVFGAEMPAVTSNKWKIGHTLGASGVLSLELAVGMLLNQEFIGIPFLEGAKRPGRLDYILVNAVGFGGNAVSILLERAKIQAQTLS
ncbi:beta-ketoacyl synthase N-terminal-like domain-containing protein [Robiginitalea sp. SC105]|uniref:beta-ketoacyl synthase N-terminal-like domain-containing protein n=1 Tax=Robiginitalea sp. SC105 TaxID=2762332 RepID=UPI00163AAF62|nr:beta-ketoacyl synthase N-terminal-like domain-containing protein [Robiginitalea sp. SC105]MBC2837970.1 beta-ketoacyl synthase [Robiginitalea sp. SC105]